MHPTLKWSCAFAQSNLSLHCRREDTLYPWLSKISLVKILIRLRECTSWSESLLGGYVRDCAIRRQIHEVAWSVKIYFLGNKNKKNNISLSPVEFAHRMEEAHNYSLFILKKKNKQKKQTKKQTKKTTTKKNKRRASAAPTRARLAPVCSDYIIFLQSCLIPPSPHPSPRNKTKIISWLSRLVIRPVASLYSHDIILVLFYRIIRKIFCHWRLEPVYHSCVPVYHSCMRFYVCREIYLCLKQL